ncbi:MULTISPECIES: helix-turn-helix domain-containing protein [unclassified Brevibacterium]|uniref:helix-turn-helix domain-containing protein n=1 Tax=unclassified Brevibacterium TaxID=2614124 RepID=UPI00143D447D|nr:helix-turn-helix domain-containing protein [Brevibacterium sp. S22]
MVVDRGGTRAVNAAEVTTAAGAIIDAVMGERSVALELPHELDVLGVPTDQRRRLTERISKAGEEFARLQRRESELGALYSSARELAAIDDANILLARIVDRAHDLVNSDLTYLSEYDARTGELFVRETVGSVSSDFQKLRVPPGKGLASMVVEQRTGISTTRYEAFESERHEEGIDAAVRAEGIVSMLGVPMLADEEVLGVIFVAIRREYEFDVEEIALLTALANHASVVLQTARSLKGLRRAEDDSRRAVARLSQTLLERDRAHAVHRQLMEAVLTGGGLEKVVEILSTELSRPVMLVDMDGNSVCRAGSWSDAVVSLWGERPVAEALEESANTGRYIALGVQRDIQGVSALAAGERRFAALLLGAGEFPIGDVDARTVERAALVGSLLFLSDEAVAEAEYRAQGDVVRDLLSPNEDRDMVVEIARRRGIDVSTFDSLVYLKVPAEQREVALRKGRMLTPAGLLFSELRGSLVIVGSTRAHEFARQMRDELSASLRTEVLAVLPPSGDLSRAFAVATRVARLLDGLGVRNGLVSTEEYLPYASLFAPDSREINEFIGRALGALRRNDERRGGELLRTLRAYVHNGASPARTARALNYHVNTVNQRLERIDSLLGAEWRMDEPYFRLSMAVRLDEMRENLLDRSGELRR